MAKKDRKPRATAPADESKSAKFSRLASQRVNRALKTIASIGNLAGSSYERTPEQVERIKELLGGAVKAAVARLEGQKANTQAIVI
jgi:hypothetical protein